MKWLPYLLCLGITLPLFQVFTPWTDNADFVLYTNLLNQFSLELWRGHPYPRWLPGLNGGLGSPAMLFYAPLPYYIGALLEPLRTFDPYAVLRYLSLVTLGHLFATFSFQRWLCGHLSPPQVQRSTCFFATYPYFLSLYYLQSGMAVSFALGFLLLTLSAIDARRYDLAGLAFAAIMLCHPPSFIIVSPLPLLYAICFQGRNAWLVAVSSVFGIGIAAFYWVPALLAQRHIPFELFTSGKFAYANNFLGLNEKLCLPLLLLALSGLWQLRNSLAQPLLRFLSFISAGGIFMMLPLSLPLWNHLPLLPSLQFPGRFLILFTLIVPLVAALWTTSLLRKTTVGLIYLLTACCYLLILSTLHENRETVTPNRLQQSTVFSVLRTRWMDLDPDTQSAQFETLAKQSPAPHQFYFPGLEVIQQGQHLPLNPRPHGLAHSGRLQADKAFRLNFKPEGSPLSFWISLSALLTTFGFYFLRKKAG